jgi:hypothetical protein
LVVKPSLLLVLLVGLLSCHRAGAPGAEYQALLLLLLLLLCPIALLGLRRAASAQSPPLLRLQVLLGVWQALLLPSVQVPSPPADPTGSNQPLLLLLAAVGLSSQALSPLSSPSVTR